MYHQRLLLYFQVPTAINTSMNAATSTKCRLEIFLKPIYFVILIERLANAQACNVICVSQML